MAKDDGDRMAPFARRGLTPGELALAAEAFGAALDGARVRIWAPPMGGWRRAFVPGAAFGRALIVWPQPASRRDFSAAPVGEQAMLAHELTHAWQALSGVLLPLAKLRAGDRPDSYRYDLDAADFGAMNIEQQAMAVEHAFLARRGVKTPFTAARYAQALPFDAATRV